MILVTARIAHRNNGWRATSRSFVCDNVHSLAARYRDDAVVAPEVDSQDGPRRRSLCMLHVEASNHRKESNQPYAPPHRLESLHGGKISHVGRMTQISSLTLQGGVLFRCKIPKQEALALVLHPLVTAAWAGFFCDSWDMIRRWQHDSQRRRHVSDQLIHRSAVHPTFTFQQSLVQATGASVQTVSSISRNSADSISRKQKSRNAFRYSGKQKLGLRTI